MPTDPTRRTAPVLAWALASLVAVVALTGCGTASDTSAPAERQNGRSMDSKAARRGDPDPLRTDAEPLTKRFPGLGTPQSLMWQAGALGDERMPGPSSSWIEGVVRLEPDVAARLRAATDLAAVPAPVLDERLDPTLKGGVPAGTWKGGRSLDRTVTGGGFSGTAELADDADVLVLHVRGGN
ncbi:MAG: hypothetical protein U0Q15_01360 [Kineosporiaceae bacterium]